MIDHMKFIIDARAAIEHGVSPLTILKEAENFLNKPYHDFPANWNHNDYPYLIDGGIGTISGIMPGGVENQMLQGSEIIDWYDIIQKTDEVKERPLLAKLFQDKQTFDKELL